MGYELTRREINRTIRIYRPPPYETFGEQDARCSTRAYAMHELADMLRHVGFEIAPSRFFLGEDTQDCQQTARRSMIDWAKIPVYLIPHLRGSVSILGRKP